MKKPWHKRIYKYWVCEMVDIQINRAGLLCVVILGVLGWLR